MNRKRSFKTMLNSRGLNIDPCGTLVVILSHSLNVLFTLTLCFLFVRKLFMYLRASVSNPFVPKLAINKLWFDMSNAFKRSVMIAQIYPPLSKPFFHISKIQLKQCCVLLFFLNLVNCFDNLSLV